MGEAGEPPGKAGETTCPTPHRFITLPLSVLGFPLSRVWASPFPSWPATTPGELRSSSYGPMIHLRLLPTPPHGDAVTISYRPESVCLEGTYTLLIEYTFRRTRAGLARHLRIGWHSVGRCPTYMVD